MKRLALFAFVVTIAACGSSTSPKDTFSGNWFGDVEGDSVKIAGSQSGSSFTGKGVIFFGADTDSISFNGTSNPPNIQSTFVIINEDESLSFVGTYVNADSITGSLSANGESIPFALGKH